MRITLSYELCSWVVGGREGGCWNHPPPPPTYFAIYHFWIRLYETPFLMTTHFNFSALRFKLGMQTNYPLAWMFFFHTLATAFPTSYRIKTVLVEFESPVMMHAHSTSFSVLPNADHDKMLHYWQCINAFKSILCL